MAVVVGVYLRISDDLKGDGLGVARQRDDCGGLCAIRRWTPEIYEDNDVSAFSRTVVRDKFEQMLTDLRSGKIKGVVAYDLDRLARQPRDLERLIDIYDEKPGLIFATLQGDINLTTADGRTMARVMIAFANKASSDTGRRVKRKQRELATSGRLVHCGRTPYGWKADGESADPKAKKEILDAHQRILAGDRISTIRDDWQERGVIPRPPDRKRYGKEGDHLQYSTVQRILTNPALAGIKVYRGEVVTGDDGRPITGAWEALCRPEELDAVLGAMDSRKRGWAPSGVAYLLSGIARCGLCTKPLRGQFRKNRSGDRVTAYTCNTGGADPGCGKLGRLAEPVDELVIGLVLEDQARQRMLAEEEPAPWDREAELGEVLGDITDLTEAVKGRKVTMSVLLQLMPDLENRRDALLRERRHALAANAATTVINVGSRDEFDALTIDRQRALVLKSLQGVVIHPAGRGARKFNPDLIEPIPA